LREAREFFSFMAQRRQPARRPSPAPRAPVADGLSASQP